VAAVVRWVPLPRTHARTVLSLVVPNVDPVAWHALARSCSVRARVKKAPQTAAPLLPPRPSPPLVATPLLRAVLHACPATHKIENVRHARWKLAQQRAAFALPGNMYPDERFLRIHLIKSALPRPDSHRAALEQAVHVMNFVTFPKGELIGTDAAADHTHFGGIYDHKNLSV
jgi:hypothetical protein